MESNETGFIVDVASARSTRSRYQEKIISFVKNWWIYILIGLIAGFLLGYVNGLVSSIVT